MPPIVATSEAEPGAPGALEGSEGTQRRPVGTETPPINPRADAAQALADAVIAALSSGDLVAAQAATKSLDTFVSLLCGSATTAVPDIAIVRRSRDKMQTGAPRPGTAGSPLPPTSALNIPQPTSTNNPSSTPPESNATTASTTCNATEHTLRIRKYLVIADDEFVELTALTANKRVRVLLSTQLLQSTLARQLRTRVTNDSESSRK